MEKPTTKISVDLSSSSYNIFLCQKLHLIDDSSFFTPITQTTRPLTCREVAKRHHIYINENDIRAAQNKNAIKQIKIESCKKQNTTE